MADDKSDVLSITEAAKFAGMHPVSIRAAVRQGRLSAQKVGSYWAVRLSDLRAWLADSEAHKVGRRRSNT